MFWHDWHASAEILDHRRVNLRSYCSNRVVVRFGNRNILTPDLELVADDIINLRIVDDVVPREEHVICREWVTIAPEHSSPQLEGRGVLVCFDAPSFRNAAAGLLLD